MKSVFCHKVEAHWPVSQSLELIVPSLVFILNAIPVPFRTCHKNQCANYGAQLIPYLSSGLQSIRSLARGRFIWVQTSLSINPVSQTWSGFIVALPIAPKQMDLVFLAPNGGLDSQHIVAKLIFELQGLLNYFTIYFVSMNLIIPDHW